MKQQLIPKHRRRKRQPSADQLREQLALAADEIIRLKTEREWLDRHMVRGVWQVPIAGVVRSSRTFWGRLFRKPE